MNIKEFTEKLSNFTDQEREKYIPMLWKKLTPVSHQTLTGFQAQWNPMNKSFEEFKAAQNQTILDCIKMEMSILGRAVRQNLNLEEIKESTELIE